MKIDFQHTPVSRLIKDYLAQNPVLKDLYHRFPIEENYQIQAEEKLTNYKHRKTLVQVFEKQFEGIELFEKQQVNLNLLAQENTVTVTTGHQLNLMTGPLYFIYKILHTVKICDELNHKNSNIKYVPIYWMATEDHDFLEINHFNTYQQKFAFKAPFGGFVGEISSEYTESVLTDFLNTLPQNQLGEKLTHIVKNAYFQKLDLAQATRILVQELLGEFGILILDANNRNLKELMIPYFEKELKENPSIKEVNQANKILQSYKNQAFAREINLFYNFQNKRERIEKHKNDYILVESEQIFSESDFLEELLQNPEKFSPNVILRPLYQEVILPNVAYVGGGGELAYWLQLKGVFENYQVDFPMLVLRNSMLLLPNAMKHKAETFDLYSEKIFEDHFQIKKSMTERQSELFESVKQLKSSINEHFDALEKISQKTTESFAQMVQAQKQKQLNGYDKMRDRLLRAEFKRNEEELNKLEEIINYAFPKNHWQEREINFSEFYTQLGNSLFDVIYESISPFETSFNIVNLNSIAKK